MKINRKPYKLIGYSCHKMVDLNGNGRKPVTLSLKSELLEQYSKYCEEHGMVLSRRVEVLINQDLEKIAQEQKTAK